jgi:hypothetical protein
MHRHEVIVELKSAVMAMVCGSNIRANLKTVRSAVFGLPNFTTPATWVTLLPGQKGADFLAFLGIAIFFTTIMLLVVST